MGRKMGDVGRDMGRAGLLPPSKKRPTGWKPTPIEFLGNAVQHVYTFIETRTCTHVDAHSNPHKELHMPLRDQPHSSRAEGPQQGKSPGHTFLALRFKARPALPQLLDAGPGSPEASAQLPLPLPWIWAGSRTHIIMARKCLSCPSLWQVLPFPYATAH